MPIARIRMEPAAGSTMLDQTSTAGDESERLNGSRGALRSSAVALLAALCLTMPPATGCSHAASNPGDPASLDFMGGMLLRCAFQDTSCTEPVSSTPTHSPTPRDLIIRGSNSHMCALHADGHVRCWGVNVNGELGRNNSTQVGDGVGPSITDAGNVNIGGSGINLAGGTIHACVLLDTGRVRCWGNGGNGKLGYNSTSHVGDGSGPSILSAGDVDLGTKAIGITTGNNHSCALLEGGKVRCWGLGADGQLGHDSTSNIADGTGSTISAAGDINVGGVVTKITAGSSHTCALLSDGNMRCWGKGTVGQLGHNSTADIGDGVGLSITAAGNVPVGGTVVDIGAGNNFTCALLSGGTVRCWGSSGNGQGGQDSTANIGDGGTSIIAAGDINLGGTASELSVGNTIICVKLTTGGIRCWGQGGQGRLGHGNTNNIGDGIGLSISAAGDLPLGVTPIHVFAGYRSGCVSVSATAARCWGRNTNGELGINSTMDIGDNETPASSILTQIF